MVLWIGKLTHGKYVQLVCCSVCDYQREFSIAMTFTFFILSSSRHTAPSRQTVGASSRAARTSHREGENFWPQTMYVFYLLFTSFKAFVFVSKINRFRLHFPPDSRHAVASKTSGSLLSPMAALGRSISNIDQRSAERASARSKLRSAASRVSPQNHHAQLRQPRTQHPSRGTVSQRE